MTQGFYSILNDVSFNPVTGIQSVTPVQGEGPLYAGAANIL